MTGVQTCALPILTLTGTIHDASEAETPLALSPTITYLSALTSANPFIKDIVLILDGKEYVATSSTTCRKDYYFSRIFRVPGMTPMTAIKLICVISASLELQG